MFPASRVEAYPPLSESSYLILLSLAAGPRHGYAILKEVACMSGGRVQLGTGTLYGALKRMLEQGWIQRAAGDPDPAAGPERKAYVLTNLGRGVLVAEVNRLRSLVAAAGLCRAEGRA
jgi:DNA-binding PadR family transcriptional regulator